MTGLEEFLIEMTMTIFNDPLLASLFFVIALLIAIFLYRVGAGTGFILFFFLFSAIYFVQEIVFLPLFGLMYASTGILVVLAIFKLAGLTTK